LSSVGGFRYRMLERQLDWQRLKMLQGVGMVCTTLIVVVLALAGAGVTALLAGQSIKYLPAIIDLLVVERWRPTWEFSWRHYRPAFVFGLNRIGSETVLKGRTMVEANWLVLLAGLPMLGFLNRAVSLSQITAGQFSTLVAQSIYPLLTRIEPGSPRFREASWLLLHGTAWVMIPIATLLGILAGPVVGTLFGDNWQESARLLPWTLVTMTVVALGQTAYSLLLASCRQAKCMVYDLARLAGVVIVLALWPLHHSLPTYLAHLAAVELLLIVGLYGWLIQAQATTPAAVASSLAAPVLGSAVAGLVVRFGMPEPQSASLWSVPAFLTGCVFGVTYLLLLRVLFPRSLVRLLAVAPLHRRLCQIMMLSPEAAA
jgi:O-antigen/teichoic acid export membrane protein